MWSYFGKGIQAASFCIDKRGLFLLFYKSNGVTYVALHTPQGGFSYAHAGDRLLCHIFHRGRLGNNHFDGVWATSHRLPRHHHIPVEYDGIASFRHRL